MRPTKLLLAAASLALFACGGSKSGSSSSSSSGATNGSGASSSTTSASSTGSSASSATSSSSSTTTGSSTGASTTNSSSSSASSSSGSSSASTGSSSSSSSTSGSSSSTTGSSSSSSSSSSGGYHGAGAFEAGVRVTTFTDPGFYGDGDVFPCTGAVGDLDGDGRDELAVESYLSNGGIHVFRGGSLVEDPATLAATNGAIAAADLDGDGVADLGSSSTLAAYPIIAYRGFRDGGFSPAINSTSLDNGAGGTVLADATGDGIPDLITSGGTSLSGGQVMVYRGDGLGGFTLESNTYLSYPTNSTTNPAVADLNHDGLPDLGFIPMSQSSLISEVDFLERLADAGYVEHSCPAPTNENFDLVVSGDFLQRGRAQLAAVGSSHFEVFDSFDCDAGVLYPSSFPTDVAVGDLNGDGIPDLAIVSATGTLTPVLSQPNHNFVVAAPYTVPIYGQGSSQNVFVGDFDGDRKLDIAVLNINLDAGGGDLVLFHGL